jgi:hypothetical protein
MSPTTGGIPMLSETPVIDVTYVDSPIPRLYFAFVLFFSPLYGFKDHLSLASSTTPGGTACGSVPSVLPHWLGRSSESDICEEAMKLRHASRSSVRPKIRL